MFERYTERARRVLFFARYEASQLGSLAIEPEHILLGLIREGKGMIVRLFARENVSFNDVRGEIEAGTVFHERVSTSVEIPFSASAKRLLEFAAEEADRLQHTYIGTEHLLLAILREGTSPAAAILKDKGMRLETVRGDIVQLLSDAPRADAHGDAADEGTRDVSRPLRALGSRSLPHYLPSRVVHITYSACSPQEEAWIQHAGETWRAFGYTLKQIVAHAWATDESMIKIEVPGRLVERTRYNFAVVLPHSESPDIIPELLREAIQRDFNVVAHAGVESPALLIKPR